MALCVSLSLSLFFPIANFRSLFFQHNVNRAKLHVRRYLRGHGKAVAASVSLGSGGQSSDEADGGVDRYSVRHARVPRRETHRTDSGRRDSVPQRVLYPLVCSQAAKSLSGITAGPLLGIFTLGMFFPFANSAVTCR